ncbi:MAG: PASTA domain-containing protein [Spirochaetes bacterium]|nr:PASTA domain-containing protein [Spirochaetota bacterium]
MFIKNIRLRIILILSLIISISIGIRIIYLSSKKPEEYNILEKGEFTIKRGEILDRNNRLLAISDELESVYANPKEIKSLDITSKKLSQILNISQKSIIKKLKQNKSFVWIKRQITPKQANIIKFQKINGIKLKKEYKRFYPNKNLASHILGFCDIDSTGVEGIEKSMDSYLISNISDQNLMEKNTKLEGLNITITIDSNIQAIAEKIISQGVINEKANAGSLILLDGKTGEILCMANYPDFDPNSFKDYTQKNFRNYSIFYQFEPGSVLKIFTIAALLDTNSITKSDFFYCDGAYKKNNVTVKCTGVHGVINYYDILKYSCNDGMLQACENINDVNLHHYLKSFGFGMRTSIILPGEQPGILRDIDKWSHRSMFSIPLGQEISVNALQILRAATVYVNDGIMIEPFIIKKITDINNKIIKSNKPKQIRRVIKKGISQNILNAMKNSTSEGGTAKDLNVEGIEFAAKSGTAQIYDKKINKYLENDFTSSLLVIFPFNNPRYVVYVVFHNPKVEIKWGGVIGAKIINRFVSSLTGYIDFYPDKSFSIKNKNIKINKEFKKLMKIPAKMPDLKGLSAHDVMDIFSLIDVNFEVKGNGIVYSHYPKKNEIINKNTIIKLYLKE